MTVEQKIDWLKKATSEEIIDQLRWVVLRSSMDSFEMKIEAEEDYKLVTAEILERMERKQPR